MLKLNTTQRGDKVDKHAGQFTSKDELQGQKADSALHMGDLLGRNTITYTRALFDIYVLIIDYLLGTPRQT